MDLRDRGPKDNDYVFLTTHVLKNYRKDERRVEEYSTVEACSLITMTLFLITRIGNQKLNQSTVH